MELAQNEYIRKLRQNGTAYGIVEYFNKGLLKEFGGTVELTRVWAQSFMSRIGLVKRKRDESSQKIA